MGVGFNQILFLHLLISCDFPLDCSYSELYMKSTFMICSLSNFQILSTVLLAVVTVLCVIAQELIILSCPSLESPSSCFTTKPSFQSSPVSLLWAANDGCCVCVCVLECEHGLAITVTEEGSLFRFVILSSGVFI